ncbi:MAG: MBL fold metallo-hydrolase [Firmicutes bacterium]|nr:MBL fold metallo-hydrolase [Bacillota bacterium]
MITRSDYGEVSQFIMGKEVNGKVLYSMAVYWVDGLLIDSGPYSVAGEVAKAFQGIPVEKIVNTHHHEDHIGNNRFFQEKGAPVFAHELAVPLINHPSPWVSRLRDYQKLVWEIPPASICSPLGDWVESSRYRFRVIHTPGHSPDHISLLEESSGWLFTGDLFLGEQVKILRSDEDVHLSMASLNKLLDYDFDTIFCCSGRVFDNAKQRMRDKLDWWKELYQQAAGLAEMGYDAAAIRDKLLGEENIIAQITAGDISRLNLIKSFLHYQQV